MSSLSEEELSLTRLAEARGGGQTESATEKEIPSCVVHIKCNQREEKQGFFIRVRLNEPLGLNALQLYEKERMVSGEEIFVFSYEGSFVHHDTTLAELLDAKEPAASSVKASMIGTTLIATDISSSKVQRKPKGVVETTALKTEVGDVLDALKLNAATLHLSYPKHIPEEVDELEAPNGLLRSLTDMEGHKKIADTLAETEEQRCEIIAMLQRISRDHRAGMISRSEKNALKDALLDGCIISIGPSENVFQSTVKSPRKGAPKGKVFSRTTGKKEELRKQRAREQKLRQRRRKSEARLKHSVNESFVYQDDFEPSLEDLKTTRVAESVSSSNMDETLQMAAPTVSSPKPLSKVRAAGDDNNPSHQEKSIAEIKKCAICLEEVQMSDGICCPSREHFFCNACIEEWVFNKTFEKEDASDASDDFDFSNLAKREGHIECPSGGCKEFFPDGEVISCVSSAASMRIVNCLLYRAARSKMVEETNTVLRKAYLDDESIAREERRASLMKVNPNARMCAVCSFGPMVNEACDDLVAHAAEVYGRNCCLRCGWGSPNWADFPRWDGRLPEESGLQENVEELSDDVKQSKYLYKFVLESWSPMREKPESFQPGDVVQVREANYRRRGAWGGLQECGFGVIKTIVQGTAEVAFQPTTVLCHRCFAPMPINTRCTCCGRLCLSETNTVAISIKALKDCFTGFGTNVWLNVQHGHMNGWVKFGRYHLRSSDKAEGHLTLTVSNKKADKNRLLCLVGKGGGKILAGKFDGATILADVEPGTALLVVSSVPVSKKRPDTWRSVWREVRRAVLRHTGEWRAADFEDDWCKHAETDSGKFVCKHKKKVIAEPHWSCCGATEAFTVCCAVEEMGQTAVEAMQLEISTAIGKGRMSTIDDIHETFEKIAARYRSKPNTDLLLPPPEKITSFCSPECQEEIKLLWQAPPSITAFINRVDGLRAWYDTSSKLLLLENGLAFFVSKEPLTVALKDGNGQTLDKNFRVPREWKDFVRMASALAGKTVLTARARVRRGGTRSRYRPSEMAGDADAFLDESTYTYASKRLNMGDKLRIECEGDQPRRPRNFLGHRFDDYDHSEDSGEEYLHY